MNIDNLSVREITEKDVDLITEYWLSNDPAFMISMGVDMSKMPGKEEWRKMLSEQLSQPYDQKKSYCIIWQIDGQPIGHSNIGKIIFGEEAYMHLHIWYASVRKKGLGTALIKLTLPYFFKHCQLKKLFCEPYALNPAPNKTLEKAGFKFVKEHVTTPGFLNFEQPVNRWLMTYERFSEMILRS